MKTKFIVLALALFAASWSAFSQNKIGLNIADLKKIAVTDASNYASVTDLLNHMKGNWQFVGSDGATTMWRENKSRCLITYYDSKSIWEYLFFDSQLWQSFNQQIRQGHFVLLNTDNDNNNHIVTKTYKSDDFVLQTCNVVLSSSQNPYGYKVLILNTHAGNSNEHQQGVTSTTTDVHESEEITNTAAFQNNDKSNETIFWQRVQERFILTSQTGMGPINGNYYIWLYETAKKNYNDDVEVTISKLKQVTKEEVTQISLLSDIYNLYSNDKKSADALLYSLCGNHEIASQVTNNLFAQYAENSGSNEAVQGISIPVNSHDNIDADSTYIPKYKDKSISKILFAANIVQFKNEQGHGIDQSHTWQMKITTTSVTVITPYMDGYLTETHTILETKYDYHKQAQILVLGEPAEPHSVFHSTPKITHNLWLSWEEPNGYMVELVAVDNSEFLVFANEVIVKDKK